LPWAIRGRRSPCDAQEFRDAARMSHRQELFEQVPMKSAIEEKSALSADMTDTLDREPAETALADQEADATAVVAEAEEDDEVVAPAAPRARAANDTPTPGHHMMGRSQAIAPGGRVMPPPRAMAKAEIFEEGDHVVYPTHGVGKVERIATEEIAGHKLELIHITFEENRMTLRVPVAKARTAGLRKLATRKMFDEALAVLKGRARIKRTMWSRRAQEYEAKINSGDPLAIAEVVRDLHRNAGQPDQSFSERQIYEAAMDRLAAELAALDRIDKAAAAVKLAEFLKTVA
jgi:CarD family transcriptional regulator